MTGFVCGLEANRRAQETLWFVSGPSLGWDL